MVDQVQFTPSTGLHVIVKKLELDERVRVYTNIPGLIFSGSVGERDHDDVLVLHANQARHVIDVRIIVAIEFR
jgi:hypothetical protein